MRIFIIIIIIFMASIAYAQIVAPSIGPGSVVPLGPSAGSGGAAPPPSSCGTGVIDASAGCPLPMLGM